MAKLRSDLKVPMSRGLGPAIVGTDQWNLAMSKVNAARDFSARVKEENRLLTLRTGSPNQRAESSRKREITSKLQDRIKEF